MPGAIQPHGLLIVADAASRLVLGGAGDIEGRLAADWLGRELDTLLAQDVQAALRDGAADGPIALSPVDGTGESFQGTLLRADGHLVVELEPVDVPPRFADAMLAWLDGVSATFERAGDLQALCDRAVVAFRTLTGFDRVMLYRFLDDEAGVVVAEDRDPAHGTFRNHHFPATDIPLQARALYVRNRVRVIPDVAYAPAPLRPAGAGLETLDLSDVALRSVSPVHVQYLTNMGVAASASVSIVKDDVLWGLIACHHYAPRRIGPDMRSAAKLLAAGLSRQIRAKDEAESYRERLRLRASEDLVIAELGDADPGAVAFARLGGELMRMLGADGFAHARGGEVTRVGACPQAAEIADLAAWVRTRGTAEPIATRELAPLYPPAGAPGFRKVGSGLLAVPLAPEEGVLLWFRAEHPETVEWAGNPHKAVSFDPAEQLTPRTSFESWSETVRGRSRRWTLEEVEAARRLRRAFHEARSNRRVRDLNRELNVTLKEKDGLLEQKDVLMREVHHRVQNSLQLVSAFLALQARATENEEVIAHLVEAQSRLSAVALVHRRLYRDDQLATIDLARYLEELSGDVKASLGEGWAARMRIDLAPILVPTDRAISLGLILTELVINATKYAYGGLPGVIAITLEQHRAALRLTVADEGRGKSGEGTGFGSRMMASLIAALDGTIDYRDNRPGLRAVVSAPIEPA